MTTSFLDIDLIIRIIQAVIFISLGVLFLIILPLLTKKRTFCGLICPFGAWQSVAGQINPYRVSIDKNKCTLCQKCIDVCPIFAISSDSLKKNTILPNCNRCGACLDVCPEGAIDYSILNKTLGVRNLFVLGAILVSAAFVSSFMPQVLYEAFSLIKKSTGF
jgi:polyferredoxin